VHHISALNFDGSDPLKDFAVSFYKGGIGGFTSRDGQSMGAFAIYTETGHLVSSG